MKISYKDTRRACYIGSATHAIVNNLAPLLFIVFQTDYHLTYQRLGTLVLINFITQLIMDGLCIKLADKAGYRTLLVAAHGFCAAGLIMLGSLPRILDNTFLALVLSVVTYAIGGGLLEVLVSPVVDNLPVPAEEKAASMSMLHSFYCWGQMAVILLSTILLQMIGRPRWNLLPILWAVLPVANMINFLRVPIIQPVSAEKSMGLLALIRSPVFFAFMLLMMFSGSSELTMSQWASLFAEQGLGLDKVWGDIFGPCMFAVMMALGRTLYGIWGAKIDIMRCLIACAILCVICYLGTTLIAHPLINLVFCALSGFAVCMMWPGTLSMASARFPLGGTSLFAILALMGDLGCSAGPWFAGWVADLSERGVRILLPDNGADGLTAGLLASSIFPGLMIITLLALRPRKKDT